MTRNAQLALRFGIIAIPMIAAVAVYLFARTHPPEILARFQLNSPGLTGYEALFGSAPSFFYTLALGLLIGTCARNLTSAKAHCLVWTGLAIFLELSQYPRIAKPISTWLYDIPPASIGDFVGPYWSRGVFDPLDLLATLLGGSIALILLGQVSKEKMHASTF